MTEIIALTIFVIYLITNNPFDYFLFFAVFCISSAFFGTSFELLICIYWFIIFYFLINLGYYYKTIC